MTFKLSFSFKGLTNKRFNTLHHFLAAAMLATLTLVLEHAGALNWLDAAMLRMMHVDSSVETAPSLAQPSLYTVLIDDKQYAEYFHAQSPLAREQLVSVLEDVFASKPKAVLIDLQLEPSWGESISRPLDTLLKQTAAIASTDRIALLLPIPTPRTDDIDAVNLRWMRQMCNAGIEFGSARIREHFGAAVRYDKIPQALSAMLLHHGSNNHITQDEHGRQDKALISNESSACELAQVSPNIKNLHAVVQPAHLALNDTAPLSPASISSAKRAQLIWEPSVTRQMLRAFHPDRVVLGGAYDQNDKFYVFGDPTPLPGALLHAAIASGWDKVHTAHRQAWFLDAVFGTLLGLLFQSLWGNLPSAHVSPQNWRQYLGVNFKILYVWAGAACLVLALTCATLQASNYLIDQGVWMNPGPVVLGMLIHALLLSSNQHGHHLPTGIREFLVQHPGCGFQVLVLALTLLFMPWIH
jgi:hypothetical protein